MKRAWSLALDLQIVQRIPGNVTLAYIYQLVKFGDLISLVQKIYRKMHSVSCTNTHHGIIDMVNQAMVKIQTLEYVENRT